MKVLGIPLFPTSTVGRKVFTALTGLLIFGFLTFHLSANLQLYQGADAFNGFVKALDKFGPFIWLGEAALGGLFLYHAIMGIQVTLRNRAARQDGYAVSKRLGKGSLASQSMPYTGSIILIFLIVHIWNFRVAKSLQHTSNGEVDLYGIVTSLFANPAYAAFYVVAMLCMGLHIAHAGQSALRTLGLSHAKYLGVARVLSIGLAVVFVVGFCSFPIYFQLNKEKVQKQRASQIFGEGTANDGTPIIIFPGAAAGLNSESPSETY